MTNAEPLELWVAQTLKRSISSLNELYYDEDVVKAELEQLSLTRRNGHTVNASSVEEMRLKRLHDKLRGEPCEFPIWEALLWFLAHPIPADVANDLIDRDVAVLAMGHTRQVDEVQWRLAELVEEALMTIIQERFVDQRFDCAAFEEIFRPHTSDLGVLEMLARNFASDSGKEAVFHAAALKNQEFMTGSGNQERISMQRQRRALMHQSHA